MINAAGAAQAAAKVATEAAPEAAKAIADAAPKLAAAAPAVAGKMSGTGWFGLSAGAAGIVITMLDTWKSSIGKEGFDSDKLLGPTTTAIGGGAALLLLGEKGGLANAALRNGMRGAGVALVLGGLAGAVWGAVSTFRNPVARQAGNNQLSQAPVTFSALKVAVPAQLEGIEIAAGEVVTTGRKLKRISVYAEPTSAVKLDARDLASAIGQARAIAQADESDRSQAVLQTRDGAYWVARLSGELDQVDGRNYTAGNDFDNRYPPRIVKKQESLQAIVGLENRYVFPGGLDRNAAPPDVGDIPTVVPELPQPKPSTSTSTPATSGASS